MVSFCPAFERQEVRPRPPLCRMGVNTNTVLAVSGGPLLRAREILRHFLDMVAVWRRGAQYEFPVQTLLLVHMI